MERSELLQAFLNDKFQEACMDENANHVAQRFITSGSDDDRTLIINRMLRGDIALIARDVHGCRVFQRLMEECSEAQFEPLLRRLCEPACAKQVCNSTNGRHVMMHGLVHLGHGYAMWLLDFFTNWADQRNTSHARAPTMQPEGPAAAILDKVLRKDWTEEITYDVQVVQALKDAACRLAETLLLGCSCQAWIDFRVPPGIQILPDVLQSVVKMAGRNCGTSGGPVLQALHIVSEVCPTTAARICMQLNYHPDHMAKLRQPESGKKGIKHMNELVQHIESIATSAADRYPGLLTDHH
jgi:hypothetical protein